MLGLAAWPICRIAADRLVRWYKPDFYQHLKSEYEKRYLLFFATLIGLLFKPPSLIACGLAVWKTAPEDDIAGFRQPMNPYQQFCWGSRTVIYISELPHLLHITEMAIHHFMTLLPMVIIAKYDGPHRWYDLQLAALFHEVVNSLRFLLRQTQYARRYPNIDRGLQLYCTASSFLIRVPAIIMGIAMIPASGAHGSTARVLVIGYVFYLTYIIYATHNRLRSTDILQIDDSGVFRIRIGNHFNITSTSLLTGLAIFGTQMSVIVLYNWSKTDPIPATTSELINMTWNTLFALGLGLVGSRIVAPSLQRGFQARRLSSVFLMSGLVLAIIFLCVTPTVDTTVDKKTLVACILLSSTLTKAASQYASHLACIESGRQATAEPDGKCSTQTRPDKVVLSRSSQFCSAINLCQYLAFVLAVITGYVSLIGAASRTILVQLVVRAAVDSRFQTAGNKTTMGSLVMLTTLWGLGGVVTASAQHLDPVGNYTIIGHALSATRPFVPPDWRAVLKFTLKDILTLQGLYILVTATTGYLSKAQHSFRLSLPRPMTLAVASIAGWLSYGFYLAWQGVEHPALTNRGFTAAEIVARQPPICDLLFSWHFWVSVSASAGISTAAAHLWLPKAVSQARYVKSDSHWDQE